MSEIYRLRPVNDKTIEELTKPYLWFSKPTEYNDVEDANIIAYSNENETVKELFNRVFGDAVFLGKELKRLGICCFTKYLPKVSKWCKYPNGNNSIIIEYDKEILEEYFLTKFYIGNCFKDVQYKKDPLILQSSGENGYDVLWEETNDGKLYKSLRGDIERDEKLMDEFILRFITTINKRFKQQKETRIILPYRIVEKTPNNVLGYEIMIPKESIKKIYYSRTIDEKFLKRLQEMDFLLEIKNE